MGQGSPLLWTWATWGHFPTGQAPGAPGQLATRGLRVAARLGPTGAGPAAGRPPSQTPGGPGASQGPCPEPSPDLRQPLQQQGGLCRAGGPTARSPRPPLVLCLASPGPACRTPHESWPKCVSLGSSALEEPGEGAGGVLSPLCPGSPQTQQHIFRKTSPSLGAVGGGPTRPLHRHTRSHAHRRSRPASRKPSGKEQLSRPLCVGPPVGGTSCPQCRPAPQEAPSQDPGPSPSPQGPRPCYDLRRGGARTHFTVVDAVFRGRARTAQGVPSAQRVPWPWLDTGPHLLPLPDGKWVSREPPAPPVVGRRALVTSTAPLHPHPASAPQARVPMERVGGISWGWGTLSAGRQPPSP